MIVMRKRSYILIKRSFPTINASSFPLTQNKKTFKSQGSLLEHHFLDWKEFCRLI
ncbi:hypothetical protein O6H91_03G010100 [Diphasiastrum complanatum]|uniref:Uncharacterized protein n=1 Tax=Diphasiastrum complanatum TaxID=34168 RepID=A0ACC2E3I7_DIPCM|nr:hypothetical protein O6H91_03G010100 [Diphasiastrum complanatum]